MSHFDDILSRIKEITGVKTASEVANLLGLKPNTLAERKSRNSIPYEELFRFSNERNLNSDWLLTGEGSKYREEAAMPGMINESPETYSDERLGKLITRVQKIYKDGDPVEKAAIWGMIDEVYDKLIEKIEARLKAATTEPALKKTNNAG